MIAEIISLSIYKNKAITKFKSLDCCRCKTERFSKTDSRWKRSTPITRLLLETSPEFTWFRSTSWTWKLILTRKSTRSHSRSPFSSESQTATMCPTCTFPNKQTNRPKRITLTMLPMVLYSTFLKKTTSWQFSPVLVDLLWESMEKPTP